MKRLGLALSLWASLSVAAVAQVGGLSFPGPGLAPSGGGSSPAYVFRVQPPSQDPSGTAAIFSTLNLGSAGSDYCIVAIGLQNAQAISTVLVNSSSMSPVVPASNATSSQVFEWSGSCTILGSSTDTVTVNGSTSFGFADVMIAVWTATNLGSNTPVGPAGALAGANSVSTSASVPSGDFVFAAGLPSANFTGSAQAPTGQRATTGANGTPFATADWVASSTGVFTGTPNTFSFLAISAWH